MDKVEKLEELLKESKEISRLQYLIEVYKIASTNEESKQMRKRVEYALIKALELNDGGTH